MICICLLCLFTKHELQGQSDSSKQMHLPTKSARPVHWAYQGKNGPKEWGKLSPVYALCSNGKNQSPINITKTDVTGGSIWKFDYRSSSLKITHNEHVDNILDNGHTIQVTVDEGSIFILKNKIYHLKQFHFHTPSEHTIDGKNFPMEIHFVHQSDSGELAVVAVFVEEGKENGNFSKILANLPTVKSETKHIKEVDLALEFHLPKINEAYHYLGSFTTPPCLEGVEWLVFKNPVQASRKQLGKFASLLKSNHRPIQALNGRNVKYDVLKGKVNE